MNPPIYLAFYLINFILLLPITMMAFILESRSAYIVGTHSFLKEIKNIVLRVELKLPHERTQRETNGGEKNIPKSINLVKKDILRTDETKASCKTVTKLTPAL